jgi:3-oxoadipate enol-lactonase/4-carboxymuconolactone decarboxylase
VTVTMRAVSVPTTSPEAATPLLVLGTSLGTRGTAWGAVPAALAAHFRVLVVDLPGHGVSPVATGPFTVPDLADAVVAAVDATGGGGFAYAGVSLGGAVGIELACGPHAGRLTALAVLCSDAKIGEAAGWLDRAANVRASGTPSLVAGSGERWFAPGFLERLPGVGSRMLSDLMDVDDESYARCCEALAAFDRRADLARISAPTLIVHGDSDPTITVEAATALAAAVPGSRRVEFAETGHQPQAERPDELTAALLDFLVPLLIRTRTSNAAAGPADRYDAGMAVRREVLGDEWVDASLAGMTTETRDFQRFITEYAWGSVWTRPGLERPMRSAITISCCVAGGHWHELELHLHAAFRNGLTAADLSEILLQTAVYAGVPPANTAFGILKRVLADRAATA